MPKIEIDVDQVLTCAVHLEADPGDRLVVMGGVVVGVIGKQSVGAVVLAERRPALAPPEPPPLLSSRAMPATADMARKALEVIRTEGPISGHGIGARLGDTKGRLSQALKTLRARGAIRATSEGRYPQYVYAGNGLS